MSGTGQRYPVPRLHGVRPFVPLQLYGTCTVLVSTVQYSTVLTAHAAQGRRTEGMFGTSGTVQYMYSTCPALHSASGGGRTSPRLVRMFLPGFHPPFLFCCWSALALPTPHVVAVACRVNGNGRRPTNCSRCIRSSIAIRETALLSPLPPSPASPPPLPPLEGRERRESNQAR